MRDYFAPVPKGARECFWSSVVYLPDGCWEWQGKRLPTGYGRFSYVGVWLQAHRFAWELVREERIPDGHDLHHTCGKRSCVNPDHLEPVPHGAEHKRCTPKW